MTALFPRPLSVVLRVARIAVLALPLAVDALACRDKAASAAVSNGSSADAAARAPAAPAPAADSSRHAVVDSEIPIAEQLRRFRAASGGAAVETRVTGLTDGAPTRDSLVRAFVAALAANDSLSLRRMLITRAEFADLYYPESRLSRPPYELGPGMLWFQQTESTNKGYARALRLLDGRPARLLSYRCTGVEREGPNRIWGPCTVRLVVGARDTTDASLFGGILERGGRFKFLSFANRL